MNQTQIAFLDKIQQGQPSVNVTPGDLYHQTQIADDHTSATVLIALLRKARVIHFLFRR